MTISIECKCGEKFEVPTTIEHRKINNEIFSVCTGSMLCPNPGCDQVINVEIVSPDNSIFHDSED